MELRHISFGATAATVTSMGLIVGLDAASATRPAIVASLLVMALADNLTDSLGVHVYQESERLEARKAFIATSSNFAARVVVSLSFVLLVNLLPLGLVIAASVTWGVAVLSTLSTLLARARRVPITSEVAKHLGVASIVILLSREIGNWIARATH
jgi:hypothetical protein